MRAVLITTDPVRISYAMALLADIGTPCFLLDEAQSAVEGSIGVIPRRLMVADEDEARALAALEALNRDG